MLGIRGALFDMDEVMFRAMTLGAHVRDSQGVEKMEGLDELLEYLRDYMIPVAAVSSREKAQMEAVLEKADLLHSFDVLLPKRRLDDTQQAALVLAEGAELLGVSPTRTLVCCADKDLANLAAGRRFVSVLVASDVDESTCAASAVVRTLDEAIDLLEAGSLR
ncbi:MAG: hypothetical protein Q4B54_09355 [Coriobacteriales bacterium]|nr:hypothetical protein [Coriobacteriales bacterium]